MNKKTFLTIITLIASTQAFSQITIFDNLHDALNFDFPEMKENQKRNIRLDSLELALIINESNRYYDKTTIDSLSLTDKKFEKKLKSKGIILHATRGNLGSEIKSNFENESLFELSISSDTIVAELLRFLPKQNALVFKLASTDTIYLFRFREYSTTLVPGGDIFVNVIIPNGKWNKTSIDLLKFEEPELDPDPDKSSPAKSKVFRFEMIANDKRKDITIRYREMEYDKDVYVIPKS